jgi:hypothetical protein
VRRESQDDSRLLTLFLSCPSTHRMLSDAEANWPNSISPDPIALSDVSVSGKLMRLVKLRPWGGRREGRIVSGRKAIHQHNAESSPRNALQTLIRRP